MAFIDEEEHHIYDPFIRDVEDSSPLSQQNNRNILSSKAISLNLWFLTTLVSLFVLVLEHMHPQMCKNGDSYKDGFETELSNARTSIRLERRRFTSAIRDDG